MRLKASQALVQMILQPNQNWGHCILEWVCTSSSDSYKGETHTLGGFLYNIQPHGQLGLSAPLCGEEFCRNTVFFPRTCIIFTHTQFPLAHVTVAAM